MHFGVTRRSDTVKSGHLLISVPAALTRRDFSHYENAAGARRRHFSVFARNADEQFAEQWRIGAAVVQALRHTRRAPLTN